MDRLTFDNQFATRLPGDPSDAPTQRTVLEACWSPAPPTPVRNPRLLAHSPEVAAHLGFSEADVQDPRFARVFGGNELLRGMHPVAARYGGHQFGVWAGQLGDGRAISLGEVVTPSGARAELQLKGAGRTPYSRNADGRAVLRSSIREFLCSEAMHHLGVPTTRALSLVGTGEVVVRDMLYDGNPAPEPGAVVCRVAPSFLRLGNWEILSAHGEHALLERLTDFAIERDFPALHRAFKDPVERRAAWFAEVCLRTADLMVQWMRVGFVHGVMNTDNLSILGLTIDYGPYGWIEDFDPNWTPNTTDAGRRRYRFGAQPSVAQWNLARFGEALLPLFPDVAPLEEGIRRYTERYNTQYLTMSRAKFGLVGGIPEGETDESMRTLLFEGARILQEGAMDHTLFFLALGELVGDPDGLRRALDEARCPAPLEAVFYEGAKRDAVMPELLGWLRRWDAVRRGGLGARNPGAVQARMNRLNPRFVLRNWIVHEAIEAAEKGDLSGVRRLLERVRTPYEPHPTDAQWVRRRPEWARHQAGCSMLSCSS
jgi:serine/tyrosine/threonine adenylyltransferase